MKIAIIVDSSSGLTKEMAEKLGLHFIPLHIEIDGKDYADGIDLKEGEVYNLIKKDSKTLTSATPIGQALDMFTELSKTHDKVVVYPISAALSSQYQNLLNLAKDFPNVHVVKSTKVTILTIADILKFKKQIANGVDFDEAIKLLEHDLPGTFILIPKYNDALVRGGRLTPAAAAIAKLLKIIPIIKLENGALVKEGTGRVFRKTLNKTFKQFFNEFPNTYKTALLDSGNKEIREIQHELQEISGKEVPIFPIPNVIGIHTGVEAIAFGVSEIDDDIFEQIKSLYKDFL